MRVRTHHTCARSLTCAGRLASTSGSKDTGSNCPVVGFHVDGWFVFCNGHKSTFDNNTGDIHMGEAMLPSLILVFYSPSLRREHLTTDFLGARFASFQAVRVSRAIYLCPVRARARTHRHMFPPLFLSHSLCLEDSEKVVSIVAAQQCAKARACDGVLSGAVRWAHQKGYREPKISCQKICPGMVLG